MEIICLPTEETLVTFTTNGITSCQGNTFAKIENLKFYTEVWRNILFTQEDMTQIKNITMQKIKDRVTFRQCQRLEQVAEGTEMVIAGIKEVKYRERLRYILQVENSEIFYCSSYWLGKEFAEMDLSYRIKIKIDKLNIRLIEKRKELYFV